MSNNIVTFNDKNNVSNNQNQNEVSNSMSFAKSSTENTSNKIQLKAPIQSKPNIIQKKTES